MSERNIQILTTACSIALLPPLWAVLAPHIGITTGAVALICAGIYVANGNRTGDALKIILGFLCGDLWALLTIFLTEKLSFQPDAELFGTLFVLGAFAVIIGEICAAWIFLPAWLSGWAIGLTVMGALPVAQLGTLPAQVGAAMIVGVLYVGVGVDAFQKKIAGLCKQWH